MGINLKLSSSPGGIRNNTQGGGQFLLDRNLFSPKFRSAVALRTLDRPASSTAEYYGTDGLYDFTCYDLRAMGSPGAAVETAKGYRYVWTICCDHPTDDSGEEGGWGRDAKSFYAAFSNDPCVLPDPSTMRRIVSDTTGAIPGAPGTSYQHAFNNCLVYNPDDATYPFYFYVGSAVENGTGTNGLSVLLYGNGNFDTAFTPLSESHPAGNGLTSYQRVYRNGTNDWYSFGGFNPSVNDGSYGKWISTDGQNFTRTGSAVTSTIGTSILGFGGWRVNINGQLYQPCREQVTANNVEAYVSLFPIDSSGNALASPASIRVSAKYSDDYPISFQLDRGDGFIQVTPTYEEDGVLFIFACHNFFGDEALIRDKLPENGGGTNEQYIDLYGYPIPGKEATAANSAPFGVKASCVAGVVTLSWYDVPTGRTYRVYRGTTAGTQATLIGDVTGTSTTNSPTVGSVYYYKVVSLNAGVEQKSRVVSTYVS